MPDAATIERIDHLRVVDRPSDAERLIRTALAEEPQHAQLLWRLAAVLLATNRGAEGLGAAQAAVRADPQDPNAHRLHALLLDEQGYVAHAEQAAYAAVQLAPHHAHTVVVYSYVLGRAGRFAEAATVARKAVELAPHDAETHAQVGDIALMTNDRYTARMAYEQVLRLDPHNAAALRALAAVDHVSRRPRKALHGLVTAGQLDPNLPEVLPLVAAVLWQLSWRMRVGLVVALIPVMVVSSASDYASSWATRGTAAAILLLAAFAFWWHARELPRGTGPVVRAALRGDTFLMITYGFIAMCLVAYVVVAVSGIGAYAFLVWPLAIVLSLVAVAARITGAARRPRR